MQRRSLWAKGVLAWFAWRRGRYGTEDVRLRAVEKCVGWRSACAARHRAGGSRVRGDGDNV